MSIETMPEELQTLLRSEPPSALSPEAEARLLARLDASTGLAFAEVEVAAPRGPGLAGSLGKGVALFVAGVVTGGVLVAQLRPTETASLPQVPVVAAVPEAPPPVPPREPLPLKVEVAPPIPKPLPPPPQPVVTPTAAPTSTLEAERRLLEPARTALSRSMPPTALDLIQRHAKEYPTGLLAEEREALWVQALAVNGDLAAARARAVLFFKTYPDSFLSPVVERAIRAP